MNWKVDGSSFSGIVNRKGNSYYPVGILPPLKVNILLSSLNQHITSWSSGFLLASSTKLAILNGWSYKWLVLLIDFSENLLSLPLLLLFPSLCFDKSSFKFKAPTLPFNFKGGRSGVYLAVLLSLIYELLNLVLRRLFFVSLLSWFWLSISTIDLL